MIQDFLQGFLESQQAFAVLEGRVHTLRKEDNHCNGNNSFYYMGQRFSLEEAMEVAELEKAILLSDKALLQKEMTRLAKAKLKTVEKQHRNLQNMYKELANSSVERFIVNDVFRLYKDPHRYLTEQKKQPNGCKLQTNIKPRIESLDFEQDSMESRRIICFANRVYDLLPDKEKGQSYVVFKGVSYRPSFKTTLDRFQEVYRVNLERRITDAAVKDAENLLPALRRFEEDSKQLQKEIEAAKLTSAKDGQISFEKKKDGNYVVMLNVLPYLIGTADKYYHFAGTMIGVELVARDGGISLVRQPGVMKVPYVHPFVHSDGRICDHKENWLDRGVKYNHQLPISDRRRSASVVIAALEESKRLLESGYIGEEQKTLFPVHSIDRCGSVVAYGKENAIKYAPEHGVLEVRIFENPRPFG